MGAPDFPVIASMQDQLREYYSRKIIAQIPSMADDLDLQFGNVYEKFIRMVNEGTLKEEVLRNELAVHVKWYTKGDGVTDDAAGIMTAANLAVSLGVPLDFDGTKTYAFASQLAFPAGMTLRFNNATLLKNYVSSTHGVVLTDNTIVIGKWRVNVLSSGSNNTGVYLNGNNILAGQLTVTGLNGDQPGINGLLIGDLAVGKTGIYCEGAVITGFRSPVRIINVDKGSFSNFDIQNFQLGIYCINLTNFVIRKGQIVGTSATSTGIAGQNAILIEASTVDYGVRNLHITDVLADGAPEHSFRIGGGFSVSDVTFRDCMSRNPGNAPGNIATGGAAFKVLGTNGHLHYNVQWLNCSAEDGSTSASGINNHAQFHIGFVSGMKILNPSLRAKGKTYSGQIGMLIFAANDVQIDGMDLKDTLRQTLYLMKDSTEPSPPVGLTNIRINGGFVDSAVTNKTINLEPASGPFKDIFIENIKASRGGMALQCETVTTSGSDTGSYTNVNVGVKYINAPTGSSTLPVVNGDLVVLNYEGPIYGTGTIASKDGGKYFNNTAGTRFNRKAGAWVAE